MMSIPNAAVHTDCLQLMKDGEIVVDPVSLPGYKVAGIKPMEHFVLLPPIDPGEFFLENREAGIINIGGKGLVGADGAIFEMDAFDCTYLGKGTTDVKFFSADEQDPAKFLMISVNADFSCPNHLITKAEAMANSTIGKDDGSMLVYISSVGIQSSRLLMGIGIGSDPKLLKDRGYLSKSAPLLVYHFYYTRPSFIWAGIICE